MMNLVRSMLDSSGLGQEFWAEAANTAVYLLNLVGTSSVLNKTPYEIWTGKSVKVDHLQPFGCSVFVHIPNEKRRKLDMKAEKCTFVGYGINKHGFRCFNPRTRVVTTVRNVTFVEEEVLVIADQGEESVDLDADESVRSREVVPVVNVVNKDKNFCDVSISNIIDRRLRSRNLSESSMDESSDEEFMDVDGQGAVALAAIVDCEPTGRLSSLQRERSGAWQCRRS